MCEHVVPEMIKFFRRDHTICCPEITKKVWPFWSKGAVYILFNIAFEVVNAVDMKLRA